MLLAQNHFRWKGVESSGSAVSCRSLSFVWVSQGTLCCRRQWTLGSTLCKLVPALQGTNIMVSVGTITAIALDRYLTIVRHCRRDGRLQTRRRVMISIALIWLLAAAVTAPVCYFQVRHQFQLQLKVGNHLWSVVSRRPVRI